MSNSSRSTLCAFSLLIVCLALLISTLVSRPVAHISFVAVHPSLPLPFEGALAPNERLKQAHRFAEGDVRGAESLVFDDARGVLFTPTEHGHISALDLSSRVSSSLAFLTGRPLGLALDSHPTGDRLLVAEAVTGLISIPLPLNKAGSADTTKHSHCVLTNWAGDRPILYANDVAVAQDGTVYLSDSSNIAPLRLSDQTFSTMAAAQLDGLSGRATGRLLRYDPRTGHTDVLLDGIAYANGVALAADESFVLVCETFRYAVRRYWLKGEKAGTSDVFVDRLPMLPDGISRDSRGGFWVAAFGPRSALLDLVHPYPRLKQLLSLLPRSLLPKPKQYGLVVRLDGSGLITESLHDVGEYLSCSFAFLCTFLLVMEEWLCFV